MNYIFYDFNRKEKNNCKIIYDIQLSEKSYDLFFFEY